MANKIYFRSVEANQPGTGSEPIFQDMDKHLCFQAEIKPTSIQAKPQLLIDF